jgi:hypothetical protein
MIQRHKLSIICLIETRVKINKAEKVKDCIVPGWDYIFNYDQHFLGRIWICWKKSDYEVLVLDKSEQSINCSIKSLNNNFYWFHSFVYGANRGVDRQHLWTNLCSMKGKVGTNPWLICGDFNVVKTLEEKWGSNKLNSYEIEFGKCLNNLEVLDLTFSGCFYTWTNKSEEPQFVARKLDRVLANEYWMNYFGSTAVEFLAGGISDHSPVVITVGTLQSLGPKPFKFYNFWMEHKGFLDWVKEGWNTYVEGASMYKLYVKLKAVKAVLKEKNMVFFGNLKQRVNLARENLTLAQNDVLASLGSADSLLKEKECLHAYVSITKAEESFLKQKARNQWLQLGDQNNSFSIELLKLNLLLEILPICGMKKVLRWMVLSRKRGWLWIFTRICWELKICTSMLQKHIGLASSFLLLSLLILLLIWKGRFLQKK